MTTLRMQVTIPNVNGLPADAFTNTWHCLSNSVDPIVDAALFYSALASFYEDIDALMAATCDDTFSYKCYDLEAAEPRVPIYENTSAHTLGANAPLPSEVACVLSFNGTIVSGAPAARRRGRIFLGPLDSAVMDDTLGQSLLQTASITTIAGAADSLMNAGDPANFQWAVFSPTIAGTPPWTTGEIFAATASVIGGHVDNAFDTMRSRGVAASTRVTF